MFLERAVAPKAGAPRPGVALRLVLGALMSTLLVLPSAAAEGTGWIYCTASLDPFLAGKHGAAQEFANGGYLATELFAGHLADTHVGRPSRDVVSRWLQQAIARFGAGPKVPDYVRDRDAYLGGEFSAFCHGDTDRARAGASRDETFTRMSGDGRPLTVVPFGG